MIRNCRRQPMCLLDSIATTIVITFFRRCHKCENKSERKIELHIISAIIAFTILIVTPARVLAGDTTANSNAQAGAVGSKSAPGKSGKVLNGSAQHAQSLNSSVKLFLPSGSYPQRTGASTSQFTGRAQYPVPRLIYIPNAPVTPFHRERHDSIPPRQLSPIREAPRASTESASKPVTELAAPASGIMTWAPGYNSAIVTPARSVETGVHAVLTGDSALSTRPLVPQFRSTPRLLTELLTPREKRSVSWDEWYKRVCRTVYDQWLLDDTGPGKTCIHVTVWSSRDIECRIVDFSPATGVTRDSVQESAFREAALRAVRSLDRCIVLEFPSQFLRSKVGFDLDISRAVDGPFGCHVVAAHGTENSRSMTP
jgi:hypothetical protein